MILDGDLLARKRARDLASRAVNVRSRRGHPPRLALIAFADEAGRAPYADRKVRACCSLGVAAVPLILPSGTTTGAAIESIGRIIEGAPHDAVFLEFPFPEDADADALIGAIPENLDVDVMTSARIERFMAGADPHPPLTVSAGLELLDGYGVDIQGVSGLVVGEELPFTRMFQEALLRRGADSCAVVLPDASDLDERAGEGGLVVVAAAMPRVLPSSALAANAVAIDVGYFNAGGVGDIDTSAGIDHLAAFAPVPGGIGPMTISVLIERVIEFAEAT